MFINGFEYILTPDHLVTWVGGGGAAHALKRLNSKLSFGHDGIDTRGRRVAKRIILFINTCRHNSMVRR